MATVLPSTLCTLLAFGAVAGAAAAEPLVLHTFTKQRLSDVFYNEGAAVADINKDGKLDIISGPFWYEGPGFAVKHEFYPGKPFDPHTYSQLQFFTFAGDINGDGWADIVTVGYPGKEAFWWENPKGAEGPWKQHLALASVDNESPAFADITGDGKPELLCTSGGRIGYAEPDAKAPDQPWAFHAISEQGKWERYTHGFGYGDVNGDGRSDLLLKEGWWEHPASADAVPWVYHAADLGSGGAQMRVVDVNGDGRADIVTSLEAHGFGLAWFEQQADHTFTKHLIMGKTPEENAYGLVFTQMHAVAVVDVDGDGLPDIVTGKRFWAHGPDGDPQAKEPAVLYWFRQVREKGAVHFVPYKIDDDSGVGTDVTIADVDGDGHPDIVVGNKKGTFVFLQHVQTVDQAGWDAAQPKLTGH